MKGEIQSTLDRALEALRRELGENLFSCCVYGSAVRDNLVEGISDINLLIILNRSDSTAHQSVARALEALPQIDPFVLARQGFERSVRAFAPKFASIRRNHQVLHGPDPLSTVNVDAKMERFLCEQALRNLRLRLIQSFVTRARHRAYDRFVARHVTPIFVQFSEALRLVGTEIPSSFEARVPLLEGAFKIEGEVLRDLLALRRKPVRFSETEAVDWHRRLFPAVDAVVEWMASNWPDWQP